MKPVFTIMKEESEKEEPAYAIHPHEQTTVYDCLRSIVAFTRHSLNTLNAQEDKDQKIISFIEILSQKLPSVAIANTDLSKSLKEKLKQEGLFHENQ